jgi:hypothetical protein
MNLWKIRLKYNSKESVQQLDNLSFKKTPYGNKVIDVQDEIYKRVFVESIKPELSISIYDHICFV